MRAFMVANSASSMAPLSRNSTREASSAAGEVPLLKVHCEDDGGHDQPPVGAADRDGQQGLPRATPPPAAAVAMSRPRRVGAR